MEEANKVETVAPCSDDLMSNLPDELICHILSFLSTKEAYRTSVLSTRWISICTKTLDLNFTIFPNLSSHLEEDYDYDYDYDSISFKETQSVYAALLRRNENIRKLRLLIHNGVCQPHDVHIWVSKALDLNVQELDLYLHLNSKTLLPSTSKSLVVLKLTGKIQLSSSTNVYFPSLKILHLKSIVLNSILDDKKECDLAALLSGCPRLEEFILNDFCRQHLNINFPLLKRLYLNLVIPRPFTIMGAKLKINLLSSLETLDIVDYSARKYEFVNFPNVDRASLCITSYTKPHNNLYTLLKGFSNVKSLTLQPETIMLLSAEDNLDNLNHLIFHNLLFLSVEMYTRCNWNMLFSFLQSAPNLQDLVVKKSFEYKKGSFGWEEQSVTPICLSTSLITFKFKRIQNIKVEIDFTRHIIECSSKLENVQISTQESKTMSVLETNLLKGLKKKPFLKILVRSLNHFFS